MFPSPARCKAIPPDTPHTVIMSLPEWDDNVKLGSGNKILCDLLETTYPRFALHRLVKQVRYITYLFDSCLFNVQLTNIILSASQRENETSCLLFPSLKAAEECYSFARKQLLESSPKSNVHHITEVFGTPLAHEIFALFFPEDQEQVIMKVWSFAGKGISSRFAEQSLLCLSGDEQHESKLGLPCHPDHSFAEYYKKHAPLSSVKDAKNAIRTRYAGIIQGGSNIRGVPGVSTEDVFLYPTGMTAIWQCHQLLAGTISSRIGSNTLKYAHIKSVAITCSGISWSLY